jgi:hypothetical protein
MAQIIPPEKAGRIIYPTQYSRSVRGGEKIGFLAPGERELWVPSRPKNADQSSAFTANIRCNRQK